MFTAQVYKIAVLSLSGIMEEAYTVHEVIRRFNQENAALIHHRLTRILFGF